MKITRDTRICTAGIYLIRNIITNKIYIGSAINIYNRIFGTTTSSHINSLRKKNHSNCKLQRAWDKYGEVNFEFEVLEFCKKENLLVREQYYFDTLLFAKDFVKFNKYSYNICCTAGSPLGTKMSNKTKKKLSILRKGVNNPMYGIKNNDNSRSKKIIQYNSNGIFIKIWDCVNIASETLNISKDAITNSIYKKYKGGLYYWKNYTNDYLQVINHKKPQHQKIQGVSIIDFSILEFNSIVEGSIYFDTSSKVFSNGVRANVKNQIKHYKNYKWIYLNK